MLSAVLDLVSTAEQTIPLPAFASFMLLGLAAVVTAAGARVAAKRFLELEGAKPILVVSAVIGTFALASSALPFVPQVGLSQVRDLSIPATGVAIVIAGILIGWGDDDDPVTWFREQSAGRQIAVGATIAMLGAWLGVGGWTALQANVVGVPIGGILLVLSLIVGAALPRL